MAPRRSSLPGFRVSIWMSVVLTAGVGAGCATRREVSEEVRKQVIAKKLPGLSSDSQSTLTKLTLPEIVKLGIEARDPATKAAAPNVASLVKKGFSLTAAPAAAVILANPTDRELLSAVPPEALGDAGAEGNENDKAAQHFMGVNLGVGPSVSIDIGGRKRVEEASVVGGIVRVSKANTINPRLLLETHYYFTNKDADVGIGPFIAIASGDGKAVDALGLGLMNGYRLSEKSGSGLSIGAGIFWEPNVKMLGSGVHEGEVPPNLESEVRFQHRSKTSLLITIAFSF